MISIRVSKTEANALLQTYRILENRGAKDELSKLPELPVSGSSPYINFKDQRHLEEWYLNGS